MREYKKIYKYEQYKRCLRVTKEKLERRTGGWKERTQDGLPMIHAFTAHRWSATGRSIISKLHDLDMQI